MRVKNVSGEVIPTYSAAEITENKGDYWEIDKPSSASIDPSIVCFVPTPVPIDGFAEAVYPPSDGHATISYEGATYLGDELGTQEGEWNLQKGNDGYISLGRGNHPGAKTTVNMIRGAIRKRAELLLNIPKFELYDNTAESAVLYTPWFSTPNSIEKKRGTQNLILGNRATSSTKKVNGGFTFIADGFVGENFRSAFFGFEVGDAGGNVLDYTPYIGGDSRILLPFGSQGIEINMDGGVPTMLMLHNTDEYTIEKIRMKISINFNDLIGGMKHYTLTAPNPFKILTLWLTADTSDYYRYGMFGFKEPV